eukprot:3148702-Amphidinium_carterae.1
MNGKFYAASIACALEEQQLALERRAVWMLTTATWVPLVIQSTCDTESTKKQNEHIEITDQQNQLATLRFIIKPLFMLNGV